MSKDTVQGYLCLAVACALGLVVLTIIGASVIHWIT
jgi:hypothetical protein